MRYFLLSVTALLVAAVAVVSFAWAQQTQHMGGGHDAGAHGQPGPAPNGSDERQLVRFPDPLRERTLANMRDHLLALQEIQQALAHDNEDHAAQIAEQRLGMSSLSLHEAHEVAQYMPEGMQAVGTEMHRNASRFALAAQNAGVTGDLKAALAALSDVTGACVACHAAYRLH
jgi:antitoxin component HigA of HigAB toxin-antitoxin module